MCLGETISVIQHNDCGPLGISVGVVENFGRGRSSRQRSEACLAQFSKRLSRATVKY